MAHGHELGRERYKDDDGRLGSNDQSRSPFEDPDSGVSSLRGGRGEDIVGSESRMQVDPTRNRAYADDANSTSFVSSPLLRSPAPNPPPLDLASPSSSLSSRRRTNSHFPSLHGSPPPDGEQPCPAPTPVPDPIPYYQYERPNLKHIVFLCGSCAILVPIIRLVALIARNKTLFVVRAIVGVGSSVGAVLIGYVLVEVAKRYMHVLTWATVIHQGDAQDKDRMSLRELNDLTEDAASIVGALRIFYIRRRTLRNREEMLEHSWSIYILPFLVLVSTASSLSFIFGRGVDIVARQSFDPEVYDEVAICGDLADVDVGVYPPVSFWVDGPPSSGPFQTYDPNYLPLPNAWENDLPSFASSSVLIPATAINDTNTLRNTNTTVYFAEAYLAQLQNLTAVGAASSLEKDEALRKGAVGVGSGSGSGLVFSARAQGEGEVQPVLVQHAKWGVRTVCERLLDFATNLVVSDTSIAISVPRAFAQSLFANLSMSFPDEGDDWGSKLLYSRPTDSASAQLGTGGSVVNVTFTIDDSQRSPPGRHLAGFLLDDGSSGSGWLTLDILLFRILTSLTPLATSSSFPLIRPLSSSNLFHPSAPVGHDAFVCIQAIEPWIVEIVETGRTATTSGVVQRGGDVHSVKVGRGRDKERGPRLSNSGNALGVLRSDGEGKGAVFRAVSVAAANDWWATCGTLANLTRTDVSLTYGTGPTGFTTILSSRYTQFRSVSSSLTALPLLAGSAPLVARCFVGVTLADAVVTQWFYVSIAVIFMVAIMSTLYVPKMPRGLPGRGFGCYSWMAVMVGDGLVLERPTPAVEAVGGDKDKGEEMHDEDVEDIGSPLPAEKEIKDLDIMNAMETVEIDDKYGDLRLRYPRAGVGVPEKELDYFNLFT